MKKDLAFSGLEAAIVLIAFVVVAAVFSYVMLGAGFFATQKSQEVTYSGIKQTTSNLVIDGSQYGQLGAPGTTRVKVVTFYLTIPEGGQAQKMTSVQYGVTVNGVKYQYVDAGLGDKKFMVDDNDGTADVTTDHILPPGGKAKMTLTFYDAATGYGGPAAGGSFTLEVRPSVGASSLITKTLATGYTGGVII